MPYCTCLLYCCLVIVETNAKDKILKAGVFWIHIQQNKYRNKNETEISKFGSTWEWLVCLPHFRQSGQVVDKFKRNAAMCAARMAISKASFLWWRKENSQKYRVIKNGGIADFLCVNEIFNKSSQKIPVLRGLDFVGATAIVRLFQSIEFENRCILFLHPPMYLHEMRGNNFTFVCFESMYENHTFFIGGIVLIPRFHQW
jgi:hypothetical protein